MTLYYLIFHLGEVPVSNMSITGVRRQLNAYYISMPTFAMECLHNCFSCLVLCYHCKGVPHEVISHHKDVFTMGGLFSSMVDSMLV